MIITVCKEPGIIIIPFFFDAAKNIHACTSYGAYAISGLLYMINHHPNPLVRIAFVITMQVFSIIGICILINKLDKVEENDKKTVIVLAELKCVFMCAFECYLTPSVALPHMCNLITSLIVHNNLFNQITHTNTDTTLMSKIFFTLSETFTNPKNSTDFTSQFHFATEITWKSQLEKLALIVKEIILRFFDSNHGDADIFQSQPNQGFKPTEAKTYNRDEKENDRTIGDTRQTDNKNLKRSKNHRRSYSLTTDEPKSHLNAPNVIRKIHSDERFDKYVNDEIINDNRKESQTNSNVDKRVKG